MFASSQHGFTPFSRQVGGVLEQIAHLERPTEPFEILIQRLSYHLLLLPSGFPHSTHHPPLLLDSEQTLQELMLARSSLMNPS